MSQDKTIFQPNATAEFNIPQDVLDSFPKDKFYNDIRKMNGTKVDIQIMYRKMTELDEPSHKVNFLTISGEEASLKRKFLINIEKSDSLKQIDAERDAFELKQLENED